MNSTHNTSFPDSPNDLLRLSYPASRELFSRLPAPDFEEMNGEYRAELPDQGSPVVLWIAMVVVHLKGRWIAKAFTPEEPGGGIGRSYNVFIINNRLVRGTRMRTDIGPSRFDDRPAFRLDYSAYMKGPLGTMRDEIRKVRDGLYLGLSVAGYGRWMQQRPFAFFLEGPVAAFVG